MKPSDKGSTKEKSSTSNADDDNKANVKKIKLEKETDCAVSRKSSDSSPIKIKTEKEDKKLAQNCARDVSQDAGPSKIKTEKKSSDISKTQIKVEKVEVPERDIKPRFEPSPPSYMWVDKYKPTSIKNIIGQQTDSSNVKKLVRWLSSWHSNHGPGANKKLTRPSKFSLNLFRMVQNLLLPSTCVYNFYLCL